jgi:hypothetical protein
MGPDLQILGLPRFLGQCSGIEENGGRVFALYIGYQIYNGWINTNDVWASRCVAFLRRMAGSDARLPHRQDVCVSWSFLDLQISARLHVIRAGLQLLDAHLF